ncbi:MAG: SatD family protein [bacterium]|nr:SatD family protein [bacterium]
MSEECVIIGDIKKSRDLESWRDIFVRLEEALKEINRKFSNDIVVSFRPTAGNEFQGAVINSEKVYDICAIIRSRLQVDIYCGVGIGDIEKPFTQEIGMRGSAFYRAREALELCKKKKRSIFIKSSDLLNQTDAIINTLLRFVEVLENSWTKRQREIANYYRLHPDYTYEQLGGNFGITKQSIRDILVAANWELISEAENLVKVLFKNSYQPKTK